jgi:hypothetical protein
MRALTIWQPFADLIVSGRKRVENRSWAPAASAIGQRIAIHAGKARWSPPTPIAPDGGPWPDGPRGVVVGTAVLLGVTAPAGDGRQVPRGISDVLDPIVESDPFADPQSWRWILVDPITIDPVPARGAQGLWRWTP